jgi:hypothetical protein
MAMNSRLSLASLVPSDFLGGAALLINCPNSSFEMLRDPPPEVENIPCGIIITASTRFGFFNTERL